MRWGWCVVAINEKMQFPFWGPTYQKNKKKKKKKQTNKQTCSPYVILFFEAENVLKEEMKKQKLQTYFVTTMSNAKRVFLINISRITVQFLSLPVL